jgi:hypothetical protein
MADQGHWVHVIQRSGKLLKFFRRKWKIIRETQWEIGYESTSIHIDKTKIENRIQKCKCRTKYFFIPFWEA